MNLRLQALGPEHPDTAASRLGVSLALNKLNRFQEADTLLRAAVDTFTRQLGRGHWRTANALTYRGIVLTNLRRYDEAHAILAEAEATLLAAFGPDHPRVAAVRKALADLAARRRHRA